jgi:hypothetical protein
VSERQPKWDANAAQLIEYYSAQGLLAEVVVDADTAAAVDKVDADTAAAAQAAAATRVPPPPAGTLAAIGYCPSIIPAAASASAAAPVLSSPAGTFSSSLHSACTTYSSGLAILQQLGWCNSQGRLTAVAGGSLLLHPLEPVVSSRLVTSRAERQAVLAEVEASAGLSDLAQLFAVPSQAVCSGEDAAWVAAPGRYAVSRKCDGTRHLLLVEADGQAYLLNRAGALYRYPVTVAGAAAAKPAGDTSSSGDQPAESGSSAETAAKVGTSSSSEAVAGSVQHTEPMQEPSAPLAGMPAASGLPPRTLLDGELMWVGHPGSAPAQRSGFFVAFDALSVGQQRVWHLPLWDRLQLLGLLLLQDAEHSRALRAAGALGNRGGSDSAPGLLASAPALALAKKQQAPPVGSDTITVLSKQHVPVTAQQLQRLQDTLPACPFPTDGLVFTPCDMPYVLGMQQLLYKWQPPEVAAADITGRSLQRLTEEPQKAAISSGMSRLASVSSYRSGRGFSSSSSSSSTISSSSRPRQPQPGSLATRALAGMELVHKLAPALVYECLLLVWPKKLSEAAAAAAGLTPEQASARPRCAAPS